MSEETYVRDQFILMMKERFGRDDEQWETAWEAVVAASNEMFIPGLAVPAMREVVRRLAPRAPNVRLNLYTNTDPPVVTFGPPVGTGIPE